MAWKERAADIKKRFTCHNLVIIQWSKSSSRNEIISLLQQMVHELVKTVQVFEQKTSLWCCKTVCKAHYQNENASGSEEISQRGAAPTSWAEGHKENIKRHSSSISCLRKGFYTQSIRRLFITIVINAQMSLVFGKMSLFPYFMGIFHDLSNTKLEISQSWKRQCIHYGHFHLVVRTQYLVHNNSKRIPQWLVLCEYDEMTAQINNSLKKSWIFNGKQPLKKKGIGHEIYQNNIICLTHSWTKEASQTLKYEKNYEGYWNGELFIKKVCSKH